MDFASPITKICEWIWCATQVSGTTFLETIIVVSLLLTAAFMGWRMMKWQAKIVLMLHAIQSQLDERFQAVQDQIQDIRNTPAATEYGGVSPEDLLAFKAQLLEILSRLAHYDAVASEISAVHKLLNASSADLGKIGPILTKSLETHGLLLQLNGTTSSKQDVQETIDRCQKSVDRKLEELLEKTAVLRVVVEQQKEKLLGSLKEGHGWINKNITDSISVLRGQGGVICQQKALYDIVSSGREASTQAQQVLQTATEGIQNCEDRMLRVEQLVTSLIDQQVETDVGMRSGLEALQSEMPILQEILGRLPKLPQRKPPQDKPWDGGAQATAAAPMAPSATTAQPTTPPVTLTPAQPTPTVIPVQMDPSHGQGQGQSIQLRLSEHVGSVATQAQAPQLIIGGDNRQPNFLITPLQPQQASSSDILRAMLR